MTPQSPNLYNVNSKGLTHHRSVEYGTVPRIKGRVKEIISAFLVITIPLVALSALLLGLIYGNRIEQKTSPISNLAPTSQSIDASAILVDMSATTLTLIASWSSTVAPLLLGFALTLASYPIARRMLIASRDNVIEDLPTPFQFAIMLRMVHNASPASLWQWLQYTLGWRGHRQPQSRPLRGMFWVLSTGLLLALLIAITDTWLHLVTHTISIPQVSLLDTASINGSFRVSENCTNMKTTFEGGCTLNSAAANTFLMGSQEAFPLLVNSSNTAMVKTYVESGENGAEYAYLGLPSLPSLANADYTGTTFAAKTSCKPTTQECFSEDRISGPGAFYKCPFAMEGFIETGVIDTIQWAYFTDQTGDDNQTVLVSVQNPYYFAAIFSVNQNVGWKPFIQDDPQMKTGLHGATLFASFCETTVYDVEYSQVNGTIVRWNQKQSNNSMANIFEGTQQYTEVGSPFIIQASAVAAQNSNSSDEVAQKFALAYSQAALALAAAALIPESAIEAQRRDNILVARVPKTPLFLLIATNLLLVVLGVILTVLALLALGTSDIGEVQARLCIPALSAAHFERMQGEQSVKRVEDLFEERQGAEGVRIGIERGYNGGWKFVSRGAIE